MANKYCAKHDRVYSESHYCEGCGPESQEALPAPDLATEYCATHDKVYPKASTCSGCDPSLIEKEAYEALHPVALKPKHNHCAEHDQIFTGNTCPAGHDINVAAPVTAPEPSASVTPQGEGVGQSTGVNLELTENQE